MPFLHLISSRIPNQLLFFEYIGILIKKVSDYKPLRNTLYAKLITKILRHKCKRFNTAASAFLELACLAFFRIRTYCTISEHVSSVLVELLRNYSLPTCEAMSLVS